MNSNKTQLRPGDISIIGTLLILPGFIAIFLFVLFYFGIDRSEEVDEAATSAQGQPTLSEQAAVIATLNAVPARTAIPRDITSSSSQAVAETMGYTEDMINNGQRDFLAICSACHGTDARGISGVGKPLINSEYVRSRGDQEILDFVNVGRQPWDADNTTGVAMPARGGNPTLSDQAIINIIAYVRVLDGHIPENQVAAVPAVTESSTDDSETTSDDEDTEPFVAIDIVAGGSSDDGSTDAVEDSGRDGATLYAALCEVDDSSQAVCDFLVQEISGGADEVRIIGLLTDGSSPFDSSIPEGIFVPQRGGPLALTDSEVRNLTVHLFNLAGVETELDAPPTVSSGQDGAPIYAAYCEADESSQAVCDFFVEAIAGGADEARIIDLLTNGSSPFDSAIPEGIFISQRGGELLLTDTDIQALTAHLFGLAGVETTLAAPPTVASSEEGANLYTAFCEADETNQAICDFLVESIADGADEARITDLLTNGSSPFDSAIPEGMFIPQRGGQLLFSDADIQALNAHLFSLASGEATPSGQDGAPIYADYCEADESSQAVCDFLVQEIADGADEARITDLLTNGSSPFDSSIPEGMFIPQRGGQLLLTDDEVQALVNHLFELAGAEIGRLNNDSNPSQGSIQMVAYTEPDGPTLYSDLCEYIPARQAMCDYLVEIITEGASHNRIEDLLTHGGSPTDLTIPDDIFIPVRGGRLIFTDAEIRTLTDHLFSLANVELPESVDVETTPTGSLYTTDSLARLSYVNQLQGSVISPPREIDDFSLPSTTGQDFTLSDNGGKIIMVYFGYLYCPDVCPTTLADMRRAYLEVGEPYQDVVVLFITLDPERDTLERMGSYINAFHTDFIGLRPTSPEQLEALKANFGVYSESRAVDSGAEYLIDHSAAVFLIAPDGRVISQLPFGVSYREITNDLNVLMNYTLSPSEVAVEVTEARVPVDDPAREYRIVIPEGTSSQIALGNDPGIIPLTINLTIGERDVFVLENHDNTDYLVGGVWVAPYETVRKQFYEAQTFVGLCTVTVGRDLVEIVVVEPN